jgi:hypothetical protein
VTDLPNRDSTRPVIAMISPPEHIALLSLPMLSLMGVAHRLRGAALGVIGALIPESGNALPPGRIQYTSEARDLTRLLGQPVRSGEGAVLQEVAGEWGVVTRPPGRATRTARRAGGRNGWSGP